MRCTSSMKVLVLCMLSTLAAVSTAAAAVASPASRLVFAPRSPLLRARNSRGSGSATATSRSSMAPILPRAVRRSRALDVSEPAIHEEVHVNVAAGEPLVVQCEINGFSVPAVVDTGAQMSVMSEACARRCHLGGLMDTRFQGTVVGVGKSDILGRLSALPLRIGPIHFRSRVSVLRASSVDLLLGMDLLGHFQSEINVRDRWMKLRVGRRTYKVHFARMPSFADLAPAATPEPAEKTKCNKNEAPKQSKLRNDSPKRTPFTVAAKRAHQSENSASNWLASTATATTSAGTTATGGAVKSAVPPPPIAGNSLLHRIMLCNRYGGAGAAVLRGGYASGASTPAAAVTSLSVLATEAKQEDKDGEEDDDSGDHSAADDGPVSLEGI